MEARSEITLKFSGSLPTAIPVANKKVEIEFIDHKGVVFTVLVNAKSWRKAEANASFVCYWAGAVSGKRGSRTEKGLSLVDAGVQIFEKKPQLPKPETATVGADAVPSL